jgi:hypothetical protein
MNPTDRAYPITASQVVNVKLRDERDMANHIKWTIAPRWSKTEPGKGYCC